MSTFIKELRLNNSSASLWHRLTPYTEYLYFESEGFPISIIKGVSFVPSLNSKQWEYLLIKHL